MITMLSTDTLIVGGGPAGLAPLIAAARQGSLPDLLEAGLIVVERDAAIGSGRIGRYLIRSDSSAETLLSCVKDNPERLLAAVALDGSAAAVAAHGKGSAPLPLVGELMASVGAALHALIEQAPRSRVMTRHEALHSRRQADGSWVTRVRACETGLVTDIRSRVVLLATGAHQPDARLETELVAGHPLLPRYAGTLMQSDVALTRHGLAEIERRLAGIERPRIAIIGGSTSAVAMAGLLLNGLDRDLPPGSITLMHRHPLTVFYSSAAAAKADGYTEFGADDICPVSGFVFRFGGFRFESRELVMRLRGIGGRPPEHRVVLHRLQADGQGPASADAESLRHLDEADVIIGCLGYRPRGLAVLDVMGRPVPLLADQAGGALVSRGCGILDADGREIPGLYGIGLAAGFRPSGTMGGERSFRGQANGLWLWQNDVGELILDRMAEEICPQTADWPVDEQGFLSAAAQAQESVLSTATLAG